MVTSEGHTKNSIKGHIKDHIFSSYFNLRIGMGIIGIVLPILLWLIALLIEKQGLLPSMSAYYHTISRDVFVGSLFAIGAASYLYKGYSTAENIAMNLAGLCALGVAIFPTNCPKVDGIVCTAKSYSDIHMVFAVLFFLLIAIVCIFLSRNTLIYVSDAAKRKRYNLTYRIIGILMIFLPILVLIQSYEFMKIVPGNKAIFWMEALAIWSFSAFWLLKTKEIKETSFNSKKLKSSFM